MVLFQLSMNGYSQKQLNMMSQRLEQAVTDQIYSQLQRKLSIYSDADDMVVTCSIEMNGFSLENDTPELYTCLASVIAGFLLMELEGDILWDHMKRDCKNQSLEDKQIIFDFCMELLREDEEWYDQVTRTRKAKLIEEFTDYISTHSFMELAGFIRFRLKDYNDDLRSVIHYALEEFYIEEQYQEFISLLKYFVYAQEIKRKAVHIIHGSGNDFSVLDEDYQPIETSEFRELVIETVDKEINMEDMIISTLITVSPKTVYIHTTQPERQIIRTIQYIFEDRAVLCPSM